MSDTWNEAWQIDIRFDATSPVDNSIVAQNPQRSKFASWRKKTASETRRLGLWYNAWVTSLSLIGILFAGSLFFAAWWINLRTGQAIPQVLRITEFANASSVAQIFLIVLAGFCLSRAQATPNKYAGKAKRYRLAGDALFRSSLSVFTAVLFGLIAQAKSQGQFRDSGDWLYSFWKSMANYSADISFFFGLVSAVFVIMAVYQCIRLVFYETECPENE